jgi:predicted DNA-binding transcriptional regulator YafY
MKIERLIGILSILLRKEKVTAPYLAEKFEVSRRTINRDIEDLCKAGIPIVTVQGGNGGISISEGYKVDKTLLTQKEMKVILAGLNGLDSISHNSNYKKLMDKLSLNSDSSLEEKVYDSSGHIVIDLASHYKGSLAPKIENIHNAIEEKKLIEFEYYYSKGVSKRFVEPYLLVFQWANWYVWGYCRNREDFRMFKLNRLLNLEILKESFESRELLSFQKQIDEYFLDEIHLVAIFDSCVKWRLIEEYGADSYKEAEDGSLLFEVDFTNKENLLSWILGFGEHVEILEPVEIRGEYLEIINRIQNKYK